MQAYRSSGFTDFDNYDMIPTQNLLVVACDGANCESKCHTRVYVDKLILGMCMHCICIIIVFFSHMHRSIPYRLSMKCLEHIVSGVGTVLALSFPPEGQTVTS